MYYQAYDVALLRLDALVTHVKPVTLAYCNQDYTDIEGKRNGLVTGWGLTNPADGNIILSIICLCCFIVNIIVFNY